MLIAAKGNMLEHYLIELTLCILFCKDLSNEYNDKLVEHC